MNSLKLYLIKHLLYFFIKKQGEIMEKDFKKDLIKFDLEII